MDWGPICRQTLGVLLRDLLVAFYTSGHIVSGYIANVRDSGE
jgi:hypothetical protein